MYPRQSPTTHTEQLGDEASVYDWAREAGARPQSDRGTRVAAV